MSNFKRNYCRFKEMRRQLFKPATVPPAPRLVNVELNPGPPSSSSSSSKPTAKKRNRPRKPKGPALRGGGHASSMQQVPKNGLKSVGASLRTYLNVLKDPWFSPAMRLGFGSFCPTSIRTTWTNQTFTPSATDTCFCIIGSPISRGASSTTSYGYVNIFKNSNAALGVSDATSTWIAAGAANYPSFSSEVDTSRVIAGATRVVVKYPATALRGSLFVLNVPDDSLQSITNRSFVDLTNLYAARRCSSNSSGEIGGEVQYRPVDATSFTFTPLHAATTSISGAVSDVPCTVIIGVGWPAGTNQWSVEISQMYHYETMSGVNSGADSSMTDSLAANGVTVDMAGAHASASGEPVVTSLDGIAAVDMAFHGLTHANSIRNGNYRGNLGTFNGLSSSLME